IPVGLQQLILNVFKNSFADRLESDIHPLLQEVKGHLFNRDFLTAFGRQDYLEAYAARWSPSRTLGYLQVLDDLQEKIFPALKDSNESEGGTRKIVCLGGGAGAELVTWGGFTNSQIGAKVEHPPETLDLVAIDIADWSKVMESLLQNIITAPPLSKYASASAKAANAPLANPEKFRSAFHQHDILNTPFSDLLPLIRGAQLVTLLFTLNELYSTSLSLTQSFLLNLTSCLEDGAMLLIIDSPGSYSTVSLNGAEKKYPMKWLVDHTLFQEGPNDEPSAWTKVEEDDSKWFRLAPSLKYPIELESMRFQLHL
ncbi:hypothetical protein BCR34DRAFT_460655, partial [Clohesyomyces aquaticus]